MEPAVEHHEISLDDDPKDDDDFSAKDNKYAQVFTLFKLPTNESYVNRE